MHWFDFFFQKRYDIRGIVDIAATIVTVEYHSCSMGQQPEVQFGSFQHIRDDSYASV